jgi:hypothetical protein
MSLRIIVKGVGIIIVSDALMMIGSALVAMWLETLERMYLPVLAF